MITGGVQVLLPFDSFVVAAVVAVDIVVVVVVVGVAVVPLEYGCAVSSVLVDALVVFARKAQSGMRLAVVLVDNDE